MTAIRPTLLTWCLVVGCLVLAGCGRSPLPADTASLQPDVARGQEGQPPAPPTFEGTIMMTGDQSLTLRTAPDHDAVTFMVPPTAEITKDGEKTTLDRLQGGDTAIVVATRAENKLVATTISARSPY